jgi:GLPGLI family protein
MKGFKNSIILILLFITTLSTAQIMAGKILYERRTNLYKKYKDDRTRQWIKEEEKNKVDFFELYFSDTVSVFKPKDDGLKDRMSWTTSKNTVYQNFSSNNLFTVKTIWGEELYMQDSLRTRKWKITDGKRKICGYDCRKAIWQANDSMRIYAWYTDWIIPSTGPESFNGLPGTILGIATEDGGVVYFAKSVELLKPDAEAYALPKLGKKTKVFKTEELKEKIKKDFGDNPWGKEMLNENFGIW